MLGMVLAAGAGRRLRPVTDGLPKALAPVDGETTILDLTLGNFARVGLRDVVVVVGYAARTIEDRVDDLQARHGVTLELVHNDHAEDWNNCYSLWLAHHMFAEGVLLANGDTVHPVSVEQRLLDAREGLDGAGVLLAMDDVKPLAEEEMKIRLSEHGTVARITKLMDPAEAAGEYIGLTLIEPLAARPLADALEATWRRDTDLYYEDGYQELVDRGNAVAVAPIGAADWVEVDDHADLARAREIACHY